MAVSTKIKSLMTLKEKTHAGLAAHLGMSKQALSNKFLRDSFSAADLIRVAEFLDVKLMFYVDELQKFALDTKDIKSKNKTESGV